MMGIVNFSEIIGNEVKRQQDGYSLLQNRPMPLAVDGFSKGLTTSIVAWNSDLDNWANDISELHKAMFQHGKAVEDDLDGAAISGNTYSLRTQHINVLKGYVRLLTAKQPIISDIRRELEAQSLQTAKDIEQERSKIAKAFTDLGAGLETYHGYPANVDAAKVMFQRAVDNSTSVKAIIGKRSNIEALMNSFHDVDADIATVKTEVHKMLIEVAKPF